MHKEALKSAWQITKKNKLMWFLGFFTLAFLNGSEFNLVYKFYQLNKGLVESIGAIGIQGNQFVNNLFSFEAVIVSVVLIVGILLSLFAQASVMSGIKNNNDQKVDFKKAIGGGWKIFGRQVSIYIVANFFVYILTLLALFITKAMFREITSEIIALIFCISVIIVPIAIIVSFIARYAVFYLVHDKDKTIFQCLHSGGKLFFRDWFESFKGAIITFMVLVLTFFVASVFMYATIYPIIFIVGLFGLVGETLISIVGLLLLSWAVFVFIFSTAIFGVFYYAYWLSIFERIRKHIS